MTKMWTIVFKFFSKFDKDMIFMSDDRHKLRHIYPPSSCIKMWEYLVLCSELTKKNENMKYEHVGGGIWGYF